MKPKDKQPLENLVQSDLLQILETAKISHYLQEMHAQFKVADAKVTPFERSRTFWRLLPE